MVSPAFAVLAAAPESNVGFGELWSAPEMVPVWWLGLWSCVAGLIGIWIASRLVAGEEGGLWRSIVWHLAMIPLFVTIVLVGGVITLITPFGGSVAICLLSVTLPFWAASAIYKIGFWKGFLLVILGALFSAVLYYPTARFVATDEQQAVAEKFATRFFEKLGARLKASNGGAPSRGEPKGAGTEADWQKVAVEKYPELGMAGTPLNTMFVARVKTCRTSRMEVFQSPDWPLKLADEVAAELGAGTK
jgi:hypothetical protein